MSLEETGEEQRDVTSDKLAPLKPGSSGLELQLDARGKWAKCRAERVCRCGQDGGVRRGNESLLREADERESEGAGRGLREPCPGAGPGGLPEGGGRAGDCSSQVGAAAEEAPRNCSARPGIALRAPAAARAEGSGRPGKPRPPPGSEFRGRDGSRSLRCSPGSGQCGAPSGRIPFQEELRVLAPPQPSAPRAPFPLPWSPPQTSRPR